MHLIINANNRYRKCLSSRPQTISLRGVNSLHQKESLMAVHLIKHSAPCACVVWRRKWWPHYFPLSGLWCVHVVLCALCECVCTEIYFIMSVWHRASHRPRATHTIATSQISRCSTSPVTCSQCPENEFISMLGARCTQGESIEHTLGRCSSCILLISFAACSMCTRVFSKCTVHQYIYRAIYFEFKWSFCSATVIHWLQTWDTLFKNNILALGDYLCT